jgi:L-alanine-DL-glutamate epimerase-like enolase superfamily enzyme
LRITGFRKLSTSRPSDFPVGDANGVFMGGSLPTHLVEVTTDVGLTGIGFGSHEALDRVYPAIDGQDPRAVSTLFDRMLAHTFKAGHQGTTYGAISAFDTALWDLKAKAADQPLWRLLGARDRAVPVYASGLCIGLDEEQLATLYRNFAGAGVRSAKLKGGLDVDEDIERLGVVAEAMTVDGRRPALMLDANEAWNPKQAVRYINRIEEDYDLTWIEEPVRRWDVQGLATVSRSVRAAVATGENLTGVEQYMPLLRGGAVDIVQTGNGGITHFLRVATVAHAFDLPVSVVGGTMPMAHAAAAVPNHIIAEAQSLTFPAGLLVDQTFQEGHVHLGDAPGIGVEIDESALVPSPPMPSGDGGPWVRPERAGLRLLAEARPQD